MNSRSKRFSAEVLRGVELHRLEWGDPLGSKLILLHGGGANAHWWDHIAPSLAQQFHVIALDFRGHGDSDHPEELKAGAFNEDLEGLLEDLGCRETVLVGHSMGGHVAIDHAARNAEVRGLVAVDVARGGSSRGRRAARLALALRRTYRTREEAIARFRFLPDAKHASDSLRLHIAAHSVRVEPDGRWGYKFDARWFGLPPRPRPVLADIRCPTLIVRGAESELLSQDGAETLANELADGHVHVVDGAGHHVPIDRPEAFEAALARFLAASS